jgi:hypothetical protein
MAVVAFICLKYKSILPEQLCEKGYKKVDLNWSAGEQIYFF